MRRQRTFKKTIALLLLSLLIFITWNPLILAMEGNTLENTQSDQIEEQDLGDTEESVKTYEPSLEDQSDDEDLSEGDEEAELNEETKDTDEAQKDLVGDIEEAEKLQGPKSLSEEVNGATITVDAGDKDFPYGTSLSVRKLTKEEASVYEDVLEVKAKDSLDQFIIYDINLLDEEENKIQPNNPVKVSFSGLPLPINNEVEVYHLDSEAENLEDMEAWLDDEEISFETDHFSIYAVGAPEEPKLQTYEFYIGDSEEPYHTQIIKSGETLLEPNVATEEHGKKFIGWYVDDEKLEFGVKNFTETPENPIRVDAKYEDVYYVYFIYNDSIIHTKVVAPSSKTDDSETGLVITESGMAFKHWSSLPDGEAFDFDNTPITDNTTLYAVLEEKWKVTFDSQGGSTVYPAYYDNNEDFGSDVRPIPSPSRQGYTFDDWYTGKNGAGNQYKTDTKITGDVKLYAKWKADTNTPYTVVYWQENANNNGYSYVTFETKTGTTGTDAQYDTKSYDGFHLNTNETDANNPTIAGDGTTIKNVYYDRDRYTLTFYKRISYWGGTFASELVEFPNIKQGQDTSSIWNSTSATYPNFVWHTTLNGNTFYTAAPDMPKKNLSVYGRTVGNNQYTINYLEQGTNKVIRQPYKFKHSSVVSLTTEDYIAIPGFTFSYADGYKNRIANLYYTRNVYNIDFQTNDDNNLIITRDNIPYEEDISNKAPNAYTVGETTRESDSYIFQGWYDNEALGGDPYDFEGKTMPSNSLLFYGKWEAPTHILKYYILPGGNLAEISNIPHKGTVTAAQLVERETPSDLSDSDFLGWYWYPDGITFVEYDFDRQIESDNIVLHPVWNSKDYKVTYDINDGPNLAKAPEDDNDYNIGAGASVLAPKDLPDASGQAFLGWNTKIDGAGDNYYPNDLITVNSDITLYAQWGDKPEKTSVKYEGNGGSLINPSSQIEFDLLNNETHTVIVNPFERDYYEFVEWNTKADGEGTRYKPGEEVIVDNDENDNILYAIWKEKTVTVTVQKVVDGNYGDRTEEFHFNSISLDNFILEHEEEKSFEDIPVTSTIDLKEILKPNQEGYTVTVEVESIDENDENDVIESDNDGKYEIKLEDYDRDITIIVTNERTTEVDVGVKNDYLPYLLALAIAIMGLGIIFKRRLKFN